MSLSRFGPASAVAAAMAARAAILGSAAQATPYELKLAGACDNNVHLDGMSFLLQGTTANGAPYWKGSSDDEVYIYYDADCDNSLDGTARWIIDVDAPSLTATQDLDGDGLCEYLARVNSQDMTRPPLEGTWHMECGLGETKEWADHYLIFLGITTTETTTTATTTITTRTETSTTTRTTETSTTTLPSTTTLLVEPAQSTHLSSTTGAPAMSTSMHVEDHHNHTTTAMHHEANESMTTHAHSDLPSEDDEDEVEEEEDGETPQASDGAGNENPAPPQMLHLEGACEYKAALEGLTYVWAGYTTNGASYYKAFGENQFLYHDVDCDGDVSSPAGPRWILDADRPSETALADLDADADCNYHGRLNWAEGDSLLHPPEAALWTMYCGPELGWMEKTIKFRPVDEVQVREQPEDLPEGNVLDGGSIDEGLADFAMVAGGPSAALLASAVAVAAAAACA